jgi:hypothetical protein
MQLVFLKRFPVRAVIFLVLLFAVFASCNEDVDIYTVGQPVPIVYCLLDPADDIQYVRIGRSYVGATTNPDQAPASDSTVWDITHEIYIEEYTNGEKMETYRFDPDSTMKKDTGFFPVSNLRVYSSAFKPVPGNSYQLYVYFPDLDKMVFAKTVVHGSPQIMDPLPLSIRKINFEPGQPYTIRWYPGLNTGVYQMIFRIYYRDSSASGEEFHTADYSSAGVYNLWTDQMMEYGMGGPAFFAAMAKNIPVIPGMVREVISVEFIMISGGADLGIHYQSSVGIENNFTNLAEYSNIGNGLGVFSSRTESRIPNLTLSGVTLDELARGATTRSLGFKDSKGN